MNRLRRLGGVSTSVVVVWACSNGGDLPVGRGPSRQERQSASASEVEIARKIDYLRQDVRKKLGRRFPLPAARRTLRCPDDELRHSPAAQRAVALVVQDDRVAATELVPLTMTRWLSVPNLADLDRPRAWSHDRGVRDSARAALTELDWARARRFAGVIHLLQYSPPRWFRKPSRRNAQWAPGWIRGRLVVHDVASGEPLCHTDVTAKSDTTDAPVTARLKSAARGSLVNDLGRILRERTVRALGRITRVLVAPRPRNRFATLARGVAPLHGDRRAALARR